MNKKAVVAVIGLAGLIAGGYFLYEHLTYVSTDNAQVNAHVTLLSSRVAGTVQKVLVEENQRVKKGDILAEIDPADFSNATTAAEAQLASLQARYKEASVNFQRATDLYQKQAIARERFDAAQASFKDLDAKLKAAQAALQQANLTLSYTKITAPENGVISRKSIEIGQSVMLGQALMGFVASDERWITANLKETQLPDVHIGSKALIEVDALPGKKFEGLVESISPSTGAIFSLLPPDNATGNFTKVVQRVPVNIKLSGLSEQQIDQLQAGLSANVWIRIQ